MMEIKLQKRQIIAAAVVLLIAVTPTWVDAHDAWTMKPELRPALGLWYAFAVYVALAAWRMFT